MPSYTLSVLSGLLYDQLDGNVGMFPQAQVTQVLNNAVKKINFLTAMVQNMIPMIQINLMRWPCGCVIDWDVRPPITEGHDVFACQWCEATFVRAELHEWYAGDTKQPVLLGTCRALLLVGEDIVEAGDPCGCGLLTVRERVRSAKWTHLMVPMSAVTVLRN